MEKQTKPELKTDNVETKVSKRNFYDTIEAITVNVSVIMDNGLRHARIILGKHDIEFEINRADNGSYELTVNVLNDAQYTYKLRNDHLIRLLTNYLVSEKPRDLVVWLSAIISFIRRRGD